MSYKVNEEVIFLPTKKITKIIKIVKLSETFYILECDPKRTYTKFALKKINKALHTPDKVNVCKECFLLAGKEESPFCFYTFEDLSRYIENDLKPSKCIKGTSEYKKLLSEYKKGQDDKDGTKKKTYFRQ